jgi:hypothetical protein
MAIKYTVDSSYLPKDPQSCNLGKNGKWFLIQRNVTGNKIRSNTRQPSRVIFTSHLKNKYLCLATRQDLKWKRHVNNAPHEDQLQAWLSTMRVETFS